MKLDQEQKKRHEKLDKRLMFYGQQVASSSQANRSASQKELAASILPSPDPCDEDTDMAFICI